MKLLLCSDFSGVGKRYLKKFYVFGRGLNCLFVGYACEEEDEMYECSAKEIFLNRGFKVIDLVPNYDFADKIDVIYVRGGNTTKLIDCLRKYNQFERVKSLAEEGALYIGNSAGSVLAGSDTAWTLDSEPYKDITKVYGQDALKGFGFIKKMVFVHASRYRICRDYEMEDETDIFRTRDTDCYPAYLKDIRKYDKKSYIKLGNNQVYYENGEDKRVITYNWRRVPIKIVNKSF